MPLDGAGGGSLFFSKEARYLSLKLCLCLEAIRGSAPGRAGIDPGIPWGTGGMGIDGGGGRVVDWSPAGVPDKESSYPCCLVTGREKAEMDGVGCKLEAGASNEGGWLGCGSRGRVVR